jgi:Fe2+ transport protein
MSTTISDLRAGATVADPYGRSVASMVERDGAVAGQAGDYLVAFSHHEPEGGYGLQGGRLQWRDAAPDATVRLEVAVADAADGRFVPGLTVHVAVARDGRTFAAKRLEFRWHPDLHRYAAEARLPGPGAYDVTVRIAAPEFTRHDRAAGRRYAEPVVLDFADVPFTRVRGAR